VVCTDAAVVDLAPDPVDDERAIAWDMWEMRVVPVDKDAREGTKYGRFGLRALLKYMD
jgi:hypothetical protein